MSDHTATELDISSLAPYQARRFVPAEVDFTDPGQVASLYERLLDRSIDSAGALEDFLLDRSELDSCLQQQGSMLYVRMTCQTDDESRAEAYKVYTQTVLPVVKPLSNRLDENYLAARQKYEIDEDRYRVYDRDTRADIELFREENVALEQEEALVTQEYQALAGGMTVDFQEREHTLPEMAKYLETTDCELRESAWRASADRRLKEKENFEDYFDKLFALRGQIASNAGCTNYRDFKFLASHRFDYSPDDCKAYHQAIESCALPLQKEIQSRRAELMGLEALRPWDTAVDALGRDALAPFETVDQLTSGSIDIFNQTDTQLGGQFAEMAELGLLDLASRKGKAPGGYQTVMAEVRRPFIFMNAVGTNNDLRTMLHEGGHAFHSYACMDDPLLAYRHAPLEFCEVASMSMELLASPYLSAFYSEADASRSQIDHLEGIVDVLIWIAIIDAFQHWMYENPEHDRQQRLAAWLEIQGRFSTGLIDWTGLDEQRGYLWHRQLHIFLYPFYYIEYGIAQIGALQLWSQSLEDPEKALMNYKQALALGGSRPLPDLFAAAGLNFAFSEKAIFPLVQVLRNHWVSLTTSN